jgi:hypothetical protein
MIAHETLAGEPVRRNVAGRLTLFTAETTVKKIVKVRWVKPYEAAQNYICIGEVVDETPQYLKVLGKDLSLPQAGRHEGGTGIRHQGALDSLEPHRGGDRAAPGHRLEEPPAQGGRE